MSHINFFELLYREINKGYIYIRTSDGRITAIDIKKDLDLISKIISKEETDIYYTVAPRNVMLSKSTGKESHISCLTSLWCDIDVKNDKRSKKSYFKNDREAQKFLFSDLPVKPSILIWSGYGYHAYWLLTEYFEIKNEEQRAEAKQLIVGWNRYIASRTSNDVDIVAFTGQLRVPGSINYKHIRHRPAITIEYPKCLEDVVTYDSSDFYDYSDLFPINGISSDAINKYATNLELSHQCGPPIDKFNLLMKVNSRFRLTWDKLRTDMDDQSSSGYCQSIADICVNAGWEDQEIVNTMIAWRKHHGYDTRIKRPKWYAISLAKAREYTDAAAMLKAIDATKKTASKIIKKLEGFLDIEIIKIEKHVPPFDDISEDSQYIIRCVGNNNILIPSTEDLMSFRKMGVIFASGTGHILPNMKIDQWRTFAQAILSMAEKVVAPSETSKYQWVIELIEEFISERGMQTFEQYCNSNQSSRNWFKDDNDMVCISFQAFKRWISIKKELGYGNQELGRILRICGAEKIQKSNCKSNSGKTTICYWRWR